MTARLPLALFGFLITAAYWPGISGPATSPRWAVGAIGAGLLLLLAPPARLTIAHVAGLAFVAWCCVTLAWSPSPDATDAALKLGIIVAAFWLGSVVEDLEPLWVSAGVGIAVSSALAVVQMAGFEPVAYLTIPSGLFVNGNYMAEAAVLVTVALVAYGRWWLALACLPAATLALARGALFAMLAGAAFAGSWMWPKTRSAATALAAAALLILLAFSAASGRVTSITERLNFWRDTAGGITLTGHGLGSFRDTFPRYAAHTDLSKSRPGQPHSEPLGIAFEVGVIGLALFLLFAATLCGPLRPESFVLIALAVEALFAFPFHLPATAVLGGLAAGHVARHALSVSDALAHGRALLRARLSRS